MSDVATKERTTVLVEVALTIALAAVLGMLRLWRMPQGGTVSLGMVPLFVIALRRGPAVGVVTGALYGLVDFFIDPYPPVHWVQPLLDYPVAYAMCGLAGVLAAAWARDVARGRPSAGVARAVLPGVALGSLARYAVHVVSGVVYFGQYAPPGQPVLVYSLLYNSYVIISAVACAAAASVVLPALARGAVAFDRR